MSNLFELKTQITLSSVNAEWNAVVEATKKMSQDQQARQLEILSNVKKNGDEIDALWAKFRKWQSENK